MIPTVAFGDDGLDREMIEVIEVPADSDLRILDGSGDRVAIDQLTDQVDQDNRDGRDDQGSANADADELDMLEDL